MRFYLGAHRPGWLAQAGVPLFVSRSTLADRKSLPRAIAPWALDSGGFTELDRHHGWTVKPATYARDVARYRDEVGLLDWAAPQDWMCEPWLLTKTGLTVSEHQRLTVANVAELRMFDVPIIPVLQGWTPDDYFRCVDLYEAAGINLASEPLVGVGSVCRRQDSANGDAIVTALHDLGLKLHGFGVKLTGLEAFGDLLTSADSMAWSYRARKRYLDGEPSCDPLTRKACTNCLHFAMDWRSDVLRILDGPMRPRQQPLFSQQM